MTWVCWVMAMTSNADSSSRSRLVYLNSNGKSPGYTVGVVQWPLDETQGFYGPVQRVVIELELLYKSLTATIKEGLMQTADYMDRVGAEEGYLIVFDRTPEVSWEERVLVRQEQYGEHRIGVWRM